MENAIKKGFHTLEYRHAFLANGVNSTCVLLKHSGSETEEIKQTFFAPTIFEAIEGASKLIAVTHLGYGTGSSQIVSTDESTCISSKLDSLNLGHPIILSNPKGGMLRVCGAHSFYFSGNRLIEMITMFTSDYRTEVTSWAFFEGIFYFTMESDDQAILVKNRWNNTEIPRSNGKLFIIDYVGRYPYCCEVYRLL